MPAADSSLVINLFPNKPHDISERHSYYLGTCEVTKRQQRWRHTKGLDLKNSRTDLDAAFDAFLRNEASDLHVPAHVLSAWERSRRAGLSHDQVEAPTVWNTQELRGMQQAHPLKPVYGLIRELLWDFTQSTSSVLAISDARARLLWVEGPSKARKRMEGANFQPGSSWLERDVGVNAPSEALLRGSYAEVHHRQHYASNVAALTCAAVPIKNPLTGELLGCIDVTGEQNMLDHAVAPLLRAVATAAQLELSMHLSVSQRALHLPGELGTDIPAPR